MKSIVKILGLTFLTTFIIIACSKKDNPADNNLFVGTYSGNTSYSNSGGTNIPSAAGKVTVSKIGNTYKFDFRDNGDIPSISDVVIDKGDEGYVGTVNGYTGVIKFNANNLNISVTKDGAIWTADCNR